MTARTPSQTRPLLLIWLAGCAIFIIASWSHITGLSGWDPDDQLRMVQLRDFLGGQGWFDNSQQRLNAPYGAPMHWSRVTELPLALIVLLLSPIFGQAIAEMIAGTAVPLLLLGLTGWLLCDIARRVGQASAAPIAMILCLVTATIIAQFMPMRIDHHGWQIMLASLSLWTLFRTGGRSSSILLGAALALWLHISLEGAPLVAAFFVWLGWQWIFSKLHGARLLPSICSFAGVSFALFFATEKAALSAPIWCDNMSPAHLVAIAAAAIIMIPATLFNARHWQIRMAMAAMAGGAAIISMLWFAPECSGGAFAQLDPLVRNYWYVNVTEGLPLWQQVSISAASWLMPAIMALIGLFLLHRRKDILVSAHANVTAFFMIVSFLIALLVFRAASVACAFAIPVLANWLAVMIEQYRSSEAPMRKMKLALSIMAIVLAGPIFAQLANGVSAATSSGPTQNHTSTEVKNRLCQSAKSVKSLTGLPTGRIVATFDMSPAILLTTGHSVLASSHHRNKAGMRDQIRLFASSPDKAGQIVFARGITHFVICPDEAEMRQYLLRDPDGLWARLAKNDIPKWLQPMPDMGEGIKIWRVVR
ncbi:MAG: hypothetical protein V3V15_03395 [Sphingorhabdus sp.]